jgi:zinc protease
MKMQTVSRIFIVIFTLCFTLVPIPGFSESTGDVEEHILPNGLRVLLKEIHTTPIVSVWSWYNVGSRNESPGITGLAHLLEHMNFKGTEGISREEMVGLIDALGGYYNGYTWYDQTAYFETLPSPGLDLALKLEAERMWKSLLDPEELEKERTVVISEFRGSESNPQEVLDIDVAAAAYKAHPYGWPTIGWLSDLETATSNDLVEFYSTYYIPNNATLVVVGDFETEKIIENIKEYFQDIPVGPTPPGLRTQEPEQMGERRLIVRKKGPASYLEVAYHAPAVRDDDFIPLLVLDAVLAGAESVNFWNFYWLEEASRSSRLYRSLIDKGLASTAGVCFIPTKYPGLFNITATLMEGVSQDLLETALLGEIEKIQEELLEKDELQKAKNQLLARYVYENDSVTEWGHQLGFFATIHQYEYLLDFPEMLKNVTSKDVTEVARKYLVPDNRTIGWFIPEGETQTETKYSLHDQRKPSSRIKTLKQEEVASSVPDEEIVKFEVPDFSGIKPVKKTLENGLTILALENPISPSIHLKILIRSGSAVEPPGKSGLATLTSRYLLEGAGRYSGEELAMEIDFSGTEIGTGVNRDFSFIDVDMLSEEYEDVVELLGEILMKPGFPEESLERLKLEMVTEIREDEDNEYGVSALTLREMIYPEKHPYSRRILGSREDVMDIDPNDIRTFHDENYYPANVAIAVAGDIPPEEAVKAIRKVMGDWKGPADPVVLNIPAVERQKKSRVKVITMEDKTQVSLSIGHVGISRENPDYAAIQLVNNILGQFGFGGRLGYKVREEMGYAYFVWSVFEGGTGQFPFYVIGGVAPEVTKKTIDAIKDELGKMVVDGPDVEELERSKRNILGSLALRMEENQGIANVLSEIELYSLDLTFLEDYSRTISGVSLNEARRVVREYIDSGALSIALAGPIDKDMKALSGKDK